MRKILLDAHADKLKELYAKGSSSKELAEMFGVSFSTIISNLRRFGVTINRGHADCAEKKISSEKIKSDYFSGLTLDEVGKKNGLSETAVLKRLRKLGVKTRTYGWKKGELSHLWKGDSLAVQRKGYVYVRGIGKYVAKHRKTIEDLIGRKLKRSEVVHHVDQDKKNNEESNLMYLRSQSAHMRLHQFAERHGIDVSLISFRQPWILPSL